MTVVERIAVTAAIKRALKLSPDLPAAIAAVAQAANLPEQTVEECLPQCSVCRATLTGEEEHYYGGTCERCESEAQAGLDAFLGGRHG